MAEKRFPLAVIIRGVDRVTGVIGRIQGSISRFDQAVTGRARGLSRRLGFDVVSKAAGEAGDALGTLGGKARDAVSQVAGIGVAVAAIGGLAVRSLTQTASQFERFETILETLEGSQEGAKKSMSWVSDFAAKTPYELAEVMDAFVKLRAYGIDPTDGTLRTLGDTAAAMGKPVNDAVEALADAITGENERLKEFGIKAKKTGDRIVYEYSKNGQTMRRVVDASNRAMIQSTLAAIWNDRYGGAMDKLSRTWDGMMSNLSDQWERFKLLIMDAGAFDWMRTRLADLLARIDAMAQSGELRRLAETFGARLVRALEWTWNAGMRTADAFRQIADALGPVFRAAGWVFDTFGVGNTVLALLVARFALLLPALWASVVALKALAVAFLATPFGWIVAGIAAVAAGAYLIYKNWDGIKAWWGDLTESISIYWLDMLEELTAFWEQYNPLVLIQRGLTDTLEWISNWGIGEAIREKVAAITSYLPAWLRERLGIADIPTAPAGAAGAALGAAGVATGQPGGEVRVRVDLNGLPPGTRTTQETRGRPDFELNQGWMMAGAY